MDDREARPVVDLHQSEGRARRLEFGVVEQRAQEGAGERGLAGAEVAGEGDEIARLHEARQVARQRQRRLLVDQVEGLADALAVTLRGVAHVRPLRSPAAARR